MSRRVPEQDKRPHRPASRWSWWRGVLWRALIGAGVLLVVTVAAVIGIYSQMAKSYDLSLLGEMPERTVVVDCKGEVMGRLHGEDRIVVPLSEVSPHFIKALLAREDTRFYRHSGIDFIGVLRATLRNVKERRIVQGASTLTMQLARNSYPDLDDRSFHRKLLEMMLARRIEGAVGKDQILEHYVNRIFFGPGVWGIQRASQVYFGKHAAQLTVSEAALIAGIIRSPSRYSPFRNFDGAVRERDDVLARMLELEVLTPEQELAARYEDVILQAQPAFEAQGGFAMDLVKRDLDFILEAHEIEEGGLRVKTTFDLALLETAERAVNVRLTEVEALPGFVHDRKADYDTQWDLRSRVVETPYLQGSLSVINNRTGGVLAIVGGRDYRQSRFNRASEGSRQIGSTVKPFVYAAGMEAGLLPGTMINDAAIVPGEIAEAAASWSPANSDGQFLGPQTLANGLIQSRNTMTIRVGNHAGLDRVIQVLGDAGLGARLERTPQMFIGNVAANAYQLATAFSVFPNDGLRKRPYVIDQILDRQGRVLYETPVLDVEVLRPGVARLAQRLLAGVLDSGTALAVRSEMGFMEPGGGKTGTTNDYRDAWFAGYTEAVTAAVWVGFDQPKTIVDEGYGSRLALPIWADVMKKAVALGYTEGPAEIMVPVTRVALCGLSGGLATEGCRGGWAYEDEIPFELVPRSFCGAHGDGAATAGGGSPGLWQRLRGLLR